MATKRIPICRRQICTEIDLPQARGLLLGLINDGSFTTRAGTFFFLEWTFLRVLRDKPRFLGVKYCHSTLSENVGEHWWERFLNFETIWLTAGLPQGLKLILTLMKISSGPKRQYLKTIKFSHPWTIFSPKKGKTTPKESTKPEKKVALFFSWPSEENWFH